MERRQQEAAMEAVLFAMGESVEIGKLAEVIEEDEDTARQIINEMKEKWEKEGRGVSIAEFEDSFQMCTRGDMYEYLIKVASTPRKYVLTDTLLETLSIIAYKQPVTRQEVEELRGVNSSYIINSLLAKKLIKEAGRKQVLGRPILYRTDEEFLRHFGIENLEELPNLPEEE